MKKNFTGDFKNWRAAACLAILIVSGSRNALQAQNFTALPFTSVSTGDVTANWTSVFPPGTDFSVEISSGALPNGFSGNGSSITANNFAVFPGLLSNVFYSVRISTGGIGGPFSSLGSTATLASVPAGAVTTTSFTAASLNWSANGNSSFTVYAAQISSDNFATVSASSQTANSTATFSGLLANATYYLRVQALNIDGAGASAYLTAAATATMANLPVSSSPTVWGGSITVNWLANGNSTATLYRAQVSTNNFTSYNFAVSTVGTSAVFSGLMAGTTYAFQVQTVGISSTTAFAALPTTATLFFAPGLAAPKFPAIYVSSITAQWTDGGNGSGVTYEAQISTNGFATVNFTSATAGLSVIFGSSGAGAPLAVNTTYSFQVRTIGISSTSAYTALGTTATLAAVPTAPTLYQVNFTSISYVWGVNGNPSATLYSAEISTDGFATVSFTSRTLNSGATFFSLLSNATYYMRVQALNQDSTGSSFIAGTTTATLTALPVSAQPSNRTGSSITANWSANGNSTATVYGVRISTDGFTSVSVSISTVGTSAVFSSLQAGTTYGFEVRALGISSATAFVVLPTTDTLLLAPGLGSPVFSTVDLASVTVQWTANGNGSGVTYLSEISTDNFATVNFSSATAGFSTLFGAGGAGADLVSNATYFFQVRTVGIFANSAFTPLGSTHTLAAVPLSPAAVSAGYASASYGWGANGNSTTTYYSAELSTDSFATITFTSRTLNAEASFASLFANATYYLRVQAIAINQTGTIFAAAAATATPVAVPVAVAATNVTASSFTANWGANGNSTYTFFTAQISTDAFSSVSASTVTAAVSAAFTGLSANTDYALRVLAQGFSTATAFVAMPTVTTLLLPPATAAASFSAVASASVTVVWANGGNGPASIYSAQISTSAAFSSVNFTSMTVNLSVLYGAGGAGEPLIANTTYYFRVKTTNGGSESVYIGLGSTMTLANAPSATAPSAAAWRTASVSWQPNGNASETQYEVWRDTAAGFPAPVKTFVATTTLSASGLEPDTTYYFKVRAVNGGGVPTTFDAAASTKTMVLPALPGGIGKPAAAAVNLSSISWSWTAAADAYSYNVYFGTAGTSLIGSTHTVPFHQLNLATNTAYGILAKADNALGLGPGTSSDMVYTLAAPPAGAAVSAIYASSVSINWSLNSNPAATSAEAQRSADNVSFSKIFFASSTSMTDLGLLGCTTYYYRVRNFNGDGVATAFGSTLTVMTQASTPSAAIGLTAQSLTGNKIALNWTPSAFEGISQYRLYYDSGTGTVSYASPYAVFTSTETGFTTGVLASSPSYTFALRAKNRCGVEETTGVFAAAGAAGALSALRAAIKSPDAGKRISGNRITVVAELVAGTIEETSQVRMQYRAAGAASWTDIPSANANRLNPATAAPYLIQWDVTGLAAASYEMRAIAYDLNGSSDTAPAAITVSVDSVSPDIEESVDWATGKVVKNQLINSAVTNTIGGSGSASGDPVSKIVLPAGTVSGTTVTVTAITNPTITTAAPTGFRFIGSALQVTLSNSQTLLNGTAAITLSYPTTILTPTDLQIYALNEATGVWSKDFESTVNVASRTITGLTPHFSIFAVIVGGASARQDLDAVRVYPNPWKPNGINPSEGKPFTDSDPTSGIVFDRLPVAVNIKIYTVRGRLVAKFDTALGVGSLHWDGVNMDGRQAASGGYFAVISAPGLKSVIKKFAIIR